MIKLLLLFILLTAQSVFAWPVYNQDVTSEAGSDGGISDATFADYTSGVQTNIRFLNSTGFETASSGTGVMPIDSSKPQITEGSPFMNLSAMPTSVDSTIRVTAVMSVAWSVSGQTGACSLFKDSDADALKTVRDFQSAGGSSTTAFTLVHEEPSGGGAARYFHIRCGIVSPGTFYMNGHGDGGFYFGGTISSSMYIEEILP